MICVILVVRGLSDDQPQTYCWISSAISATHDIIIESGEVLLDFALPYLSRKLL